MVCYVVYIAEDEAVYEGRSLTGSKKVMYFETSCGENAKIASVAQLVEHRFRKPEVKGSSPFAGSIESRG